MRKKMYSTPVIVLTIIGVCLILIGNVVATGLVAKNIVKTVTSEIHSYESGDLFGDEYADDSYDDDYFDDYGEPEEHHSAEDMEGVDPSTEALADITTYEADGTTVQYTTDSYQLQKQIGDNGIVMLDIKFPVVTGIDEARVEAINKLLKDQAMVSADQYYLDVAGRSQVEAGSDGYLYIISEVTYQVTYLSDDFISVVYEDNYCAGDYNVQYIDMRSCNIDLKTGKSYDLNQIVHSDKDMAQDFMQRLDDKYQYNEVIYGIDEKDYESMLQGNKECDDSFMGFYRTEDGLEIYVTFHYFTDEVSTVGWLTCPYTFEDMQDYQSDSDFWDIAQ